MKWNLLQTYVANVQIVVDLRWLVFSIESCLLKLKLLFTRTQLYQLKITKVTKHVFTKHCAKKFTMSIWNICEHSINTQRIR